MTRARQEGPTCHLGLATCFDVEGKVFPELGFLAELERVIDQRDEKRPPGSYTTKLLESGVQRMAQKVG